MASPNKLIDMSHPGLPKPSLTDRLPSLAMANYRTVASTQRLESNTSDEQAILGTPEAHEIITNEGESTFVVHSTTKVIAEAIMVGGMALDGQYYAPDKPDLHSTVKMLPKQGEKGFIERAVHGLSYRLAGTGDVRAAKIVAELDMSNPGSSIKSNQFEGTPLEQADGKNIIETGDEEKPFAIPAERIKGYFDLDTATGMAEFIANPNFVAIPRALGHTALGQ